MLSDTLGATLIGNQWGNKRTTRAAEGTMKVDQDF